MSPREQHYKLNESYLTIQAMTKLKMILRSEFGCSSSRKRREFERAMSNRLRIRIRLSVVKPKQEASNKPEDHSSILSNYLLEQMHEKIFASLKCQE